MSIQTKSLIFVLSFFSNVVHGHNQASMAKVKSHLPIDTYTISAIRFEEFIECQILTAREHTDEIIHILKNLPIFA